MVTKKRVRVIKNLDEPETHEVLASAITRLSDHISKMKKSGINEKAIIVLLHHETGISQTNIRAVINALGSLEKFYCVGNN